MKPSPRRPIVLGLVVLGLLLLAVLVQMAGQPADAPGFFVATRTLQIPSILLLFTGALGMAFLGSLRFYLEYR